VRVRVRGGRRRMRVVRGVRRWCERCPATAYPTAPPPPACSVAPLSTRSNFSSDTIVAVAVRSAYLILSIFSYLCRECVELPLTEWCSGLLLCEACVTRRVLRAGSAPSSAKRKQKKVCDGCYNKMVAAANREARTGKKKEGEERKTATYKEPTFEEIAAAAGELNSGPNQSGDRSSIARVLSAAPMEMTLEVGGDSSDDDDDDIDLGR